MICVYDLLESQDLLLFRYLLVQTMCTMVWNACRVYDSNQVCGKTTMTSMCI